MKRKHILIFGLMAALLLSGCSGSSPDSKNPGEQVGQVDENEGKGVNTLPEMTGSGVKKIDVVFEDENVSHIKYKGIKEGHRAKFVNDMYALNFNDWFLEVESGIIHEIAIKDNARVALVYSMDEKDTKATVHFIEDMDKLSEEDSANLIENMEKKEGIDTLPLLTGSGVEKMESVFDDEMQSYTVYRGVTDKEIESYKYELEEKGFKDWERIEAEDEGNYYDTGYRDGSQITMIFSQDSGSKEVKVYYIEGLIFPDGMPEITE